MKPQSKILAIVFAVCLSGLAYFLLPPSCPESARKMAVIFVFAAVCWSAEIIPLYATSLIIVLLEVFLLSRPQGVPYETFLKPFANPVIFLFLGGFVLSRAFQKWGVDKRLASFFLGCFGRSPYRMLLGVMLVTAFLSMWLSNTAAAALMFALAQPLLSGLEAKDRFKKGLVLAIAFAATYGGIATPIGTPPNALAVGMLAQHGISISFLKWTALALPFVIILILFSSFCLIMFFPAKQKELEAFAAPAAKICSQEKAVLVIAGMTVILWLSGSWHKIPEAVTALFAVGVLAASGLVESKDIRNLEWDILILMWGGLALGAGMEATGLAGWLVGLPIFAHSGFALMGIFCALTVFLSTFVSNTATVNLLLPLALSFSGQDILPLAIVIAVSSSLDFPLPVATPPMAMAYGTGHVHVPEILKIGTILTLLSNLLLGTAVYFLFR